MSHAKSFPLDLGRTQYSYIERSNPAILGLLERHVLASRSSARVLDVGCGCGANARAIKDAHPRTFIQGIEPGGRAAELARASCDAVYEGMFQDWARQARDEAPYDALLLSDVLEHIADPIVFLRDLGAIPAVKDATWIVSVPNYAVWYNRLRTLLGVQGYAWSGLWDRTHLRFYTRRSIRELLDYCGLETFDQACTPSLVQSTAPLLRKLFEREVDAGEHLALTESTPYKIYRSVVEPAEQRVCELWPGLLGFQVVHAARLRR